jgi:hypothetical protein
VSRPPAGGIAPPSLPGYRFIEHIGAGGNAQVYLYEQDLPRRKAAVKVLNESALTDDARRRFTTEANVTAGLAHRHIVQVFEANVTGDGRPYLVMPYYPQPNLSVRARRSHFSVADVLRIGIQIGSAVETSHRQGVLHRDIKPQNILTDSYGEPALTDFGIATTTGGDGPEGLSVPWAPPEILYGTGPGDQRSDVYSLGATLWHLLAGRSPFEQTGGDNSAFALMGRIKADPPPSTKRADVPGSLERLLRQAMAKDPAARPQSAMELIRGLQSVEQELRLPLTHPILPAAEARPETQGGDTIIRLRARGETVSGWDHGRGPADGAAPAGGTQPGWGQGRGPADPRTHGGRHRVGTAQAGPVPTGPAQAGHAHGGPVQGGHVQAGPPPWDRPAQEPRDQAAGHGTASTASGWAASSGKVGAPAWNGAPVSRVPAAPPAQEDPTRSRRPVRIAPWGDAAGVSGQASPRGFPPEAPDLATMARPALLRQPAQPPQPAWAGAPGQPGAYQAPASPPPDGVGPRHGAETARPSRRVLLAGGGVLLVAVAAVAFFTLRPGQGQPGAAASGTAQSQRQAASQGGGQNALGPGATAPGQPAVTAEQSGASQVRFSWTYANPAAGDSFRWKRVSGTAGSSGGVVTKPALLVSLPAGQTLCVVIQARRASGQASDPSQPVCWPSSPS